MSESEKTLDIQGIGKIIPIVLAKRLKATDLFRTIILIFIFIIVISIFIWLYSIFTLPTNNCALLKQVYNNEVVPLSPISKDSVFDEPLYDFYIKTAYNAASPGNFKNSFVDSPNTDPPFCGIETCLRQGARCLDFEIYSYNNEPVIATSALDSVFIKQTFNYLKFSDAMNYISESAFSPSITTLFSDPLILNFRVMSKRENNPIYPKMANILLSSFGDRLLSSKYNLMNSCRNLGHEPLSTFKEKIIIIIDENTYNELKIICPVMKTQNCSTDPTPKSNSLGSQSEQLSNTQNEINTSQCQNPNLLEFINMHSGSPYIHTFRVSNFKLADTSQITYANQTMLTMLLPDLNANAINFNPSLGFTTGCQLVGMSFQNFDTNMEYYTLFFNKAGYAFAYKPKLLRYEKVYVPPPPSYPTSTNLNRRNLVFTTGTGTKVNLTQASPGQDPDFCQGFPTPNHPACTHNNTETLTNTPPPPSTPPNPTTN
jgi:hypothetical protein